MTALVSQKKFNLLLLSLFSIVFIWSAIEPMDYFTWFLEVLPAILGLAILIFTYKSFPFTKLLYFLMFVHAIILLVGGHYTYAEVPLFHWIKDAFEQSRNNYDKVGHFAQGFIPVMIVREIFIRQAVIANKK